MAKKNQPAQAVGASKREPLVGVRPEELDASPDDRVIRTEYVSLDDLAKRREVMNAKKHRLDEMDESMRRFGYTAPPMLNETTGTLIAGHGRIDTLLERRLSGRGAPKGVFIRGGVWLVPVIRGIAFSTDTEALAYVMADNRLTEIGGYDWHKLGEMARIVAQSEEGLSGTGFFDMAEIEAQAEREVKEFMAGAGDTSGDGGGLPEFGGGSGGGLGEHGEGGQQQGLPHIRFGTHRMFMSEDDAALLQCHIDAYSEQYGSLHGLAGIIARTLKPLG